MQQAKFEPGMLSKMQQADSAVTILWMTSTNDYRKLRTLPGCQDLKDIPAEKDLSHIEKLDKMV